MDETKKVSRTKTAPIKEGLKIISGDPFMDVMHEISNEIRSDSKIRTLT